MREIAAKCRLSIGAVHKILAKHREQSAGCQMELSAAEELILEECELVETAAEEDGPREEPQRREVKSTCSLPEETEAQEAEDRSLDRVMARLGLLDDAAALFSPGENVSWAGVMMAAVVLSTSPFLSLVKKSYGSIGPAFYGLRTVMMSYVMMALLRIQRIEDLRREDPRKLGRVLGLDRVAEVKTLRRKWHRLCKAGKALELMEELGRSRLGELDEPPEVIMVDGHIGVYTGKRKIGEVFCTRANRVVKGRTENWVHLPGGQPLLALSCPFNEGLGQGLQEAITKSKELTGQDSLTCVFDRGGWSTELWEQILAAGDHIISYRKGSFDAWGVEAFEPGPIQINGKEHAFSPCMREVDIPVYEKKVSHKGCKINYRKTKRILNLKEVRILRADGGQTSILTSRRDLSAEQIVSLQLARWGDQENQFKYMLREFDLDALWMYGTEPIDKGVDHPHGHYTHLQKELRKLMDQRKKLLNRVWSSLPNTPEVENEAQATERIVQWIRTTGGGQFDELNAIEASIANLQEQLEKTPARESVAAAQYEQLKPESKRLSNVIKTVACDVEKTLAEMITPHYANAHNEKRRLIAAALKTSGCLRLEPGLLVVQLDPQSSPSRTRAVDALCQKLNDHQARFPGSNRIIRFETNRPAV